MTTNRTLLLLGSQGRFQILKFKQDNLDFKQTNKQINKRPESITRVENAGDRRQIAKTTICHKLTSAGDSSTMTRILDLLYILLEARANS